MRQLLIFSHASTVFALLGVLHAECRHGVAMFEEVFAHDTAAMVMPVMRDREAVEVTRIAGTRQRHSLTRMQRMTQAAYFHCDTRAHLPSRCC